MIGVTKDILEKLERHFLKIEKTMSTNLDYKMYIKLASEYSQLQPIISLIRKLNQLDQEYENLNDILNDSSSELEMRNLAEEEISILLNNKEIFEKKLKNLLISKDEENNKSVILEIRAGTGGLEAALFSGNLFRMYERYAMNQGWKSEVISANEGEIGGYKEIIITISGKNVFSKLKFESGVHRVQRIPETETGGRIHTSAVTVAVLPTIENIDIDIRSEDLRIDTMRSSGAGGQHVNTTDSAVRITHLPTGITVIQTEKSQHQNRSRAMQILRMRIYNMKQQKLEKERSFSRKTQVGSGDRSERIRTYNFSQGRVTDHRINLTLYKLDRIMEGNIDEIIDSLHADHKMKFLIS